MNREREQTLISRVIDGDASDDQWREFEAMAEADPELWRHMAEAQRDHSALVFGMSAEGAKADSFRLSRSSDGTGTIPQQHRLRLASASAWSGWAVAALIAIASSLTLKDRHFDSRTHEPKVRTAGLPFDSAADSFFDAYLERGQQTGQVVAEVPTRVLVDTRPVGSGQGFEVIYIRQVLERTVVPDIFEIEGENELGQPTFIRYEQPMRSSM